MEALAPVEVVGQLALDGATISRARVGRIHDTFIADGPAGKWVLQRINTDVFSDPNALMENAILTRQCVVAAGGSGLEYRSTVTGSSVATADDGGVWRSYRFVEGRVIERPSEVSEVARLARGFGAFAAALQTQEPTRWHQVLPRFHDHSSRVGDLLEAVRLDHVGRVAQATADIDALAEVIESLERLDEFDAWAHVPIRVAHHDAKCVNAVADTASGRTTILDLDTVMAGTILSDIGELVRSCARRTDGDRQDFIIKHARYAVEGFMEGWDGILVETERAAMPIAGLMMTAQNATRFMTDYLSGDHYYKRDNKPLANLEHARTLVDFAQIQLLHLDQVRRIVNDLQ
jgi:hypothetical protein